MRDRYDNKDRYDNIDGYDDIDSFDDTDGFDDIDSYDDIDSFDDTESYDDIDRFDERTQYGDRNQYSRRVRQEHRTGAGSSNRQSSNVRRSRRDEYAGRSQAAGRKKRTREAGYDNPKRTREAGYDNKERYSNNEQLIRKLRTLERRVGMLWIFLIIITICAIIGIVVTNINRIKGTPLDSSVILSEKRKFIVTTDESLFGEYGSMAEYSEANYINYLGHAYILIGTYPDCDYVKISPNVARNDYNWNTDFYVGEGDLYYNYFKDGEARGKIAIDVSEFQNDIEWDKVKSAGIDIAIVRVAYRGYGNGVIKDDSKAEYNMKGAKEAGLDLGVYFFSSAVNREEGIEEAKYTLSKIKGMDVTEPVVIDTEYILESPDARSNVISVEERTDAVVAFCETIEEAGYTPMIYASRDHFLFYLDLDRIGKWEFWLASYDTPVFPYHTEGYQYSPYGYVDGIQTYVDLDVWMRPDE